MNKKFKIAVVGCGSMSNEWIKYAIDREDAEIVALVDIKIDSAKTLAERYDLKCGIFPSLENAVKSTGANLVFNITTPEEHINVAASAFSLGCDVMSEKPMASSIEEAQSIVRKAEKTGKYYAVMQNRRYNKNIRALKDIISSGTIGEVGYIGADFFLGPHFGGFRDIMESPLLLDMAIHTFDQARFISGADPVSVYCQEFNPIGSWYKGDASAICIFEMSDKSIFCYRGSWCSEGFNTSWESSWRVTGNKGTAIWDGQNLPFSEVIELPIMEQSFINEYVRIEAKDNWNGREGHFGCLDEMFSSLLAKKVSETDCRDNIKSMAMVFGAIESSRSGKKVLI